MRIPNILTPKERSSQRLGHSRAMLDLIGNRGDASGIRDPQYDYLKRAEEFSHRANNLRNQARTQRAENTSINIVNSMPAPEGPLNLATTGGKGPVAAFPVPSGKFGNFLRAIGAQESGGDYGVVNDTSGALGKYQIMPANIPSWSQQALGHEVSTSRFLSNPRLQETIARFMLQRMFRTGGARGAASEWYSGGQDNWQTNPDVTNYVNEVLARMGAGG